MIAAMSRSLLGVACGSFAFGRRAIQASSVGFRYTIIVTRVFQSARPSAILELPHRPQRPSDAPKTAFSSGQGFCLAVGQVLSATKSTNRPGWTSALTSGQTGNTLSSRYLDAHSGEPPC